MDLSTVSAKEKYKKLRIMCMEGKSTQDKIFSEYGIAVDNEEPEEYLKYLVNLSVNNIEIQRKIAEILPELPISHTLGKFLMMITNNILADQPQLKHQVIRENLQIILLIVDSIAEHSETHFEWAYFSLSKLISNGLPLLFSVLPKDKFEIIIDFLPYRLEKAWDLRETLVPDLIALEDLQFLCDTYSTHIEKFLIITNYISRQTEIKEQLARVLLTTGVLSKLYITLAETSEEGLKAVILQILANTICAETLEALNENIQTILRSAELDIKQPTTREWVFVIIKNAMPLSPEFSSKLSKLYQNTLTNN